MKKAFLILLFVFAGSAAFCQVVTLKKKYYIIYFHEKQKAPLYTTYTLRKAYLSTNKRHGSFKADTAEAADMQASDSVYDDPQYDKGHLTPDADFRFDTLAEAQTFLYTNAAPQQDYFNEHLWAALEGHVRNVCKQYGNVRVYTGCLYSSQKLHGIGIPGYFWKVIVYKDNGKTVKEAYKAENIKPASNKYTSITTTLADIRKRTGLRF